jgi:hypothetical protein
VQVHYGEGIASHTGPKPCVVAREGEDEASAGERIGQPLSCEISVNSGADAITEAESNIGRGANASPILARRGQRPWHVRTLLVWEPDFLPIVKGESGGAVTPPSGPGWIEPPD